jgi:hypothetical protein
VLHYLVRCGWLRTEIEHDFTRLCTVPDDALHLLALLDSSRVEESEPSLLGRIYTIRDLLQSAVSKDAGYIQIRLTEAHRQSVALRQALLALQHNMGLHIEQALQQFKSNAALQRFFQHYQGEILNPLYHQLRSSDQVPRLRSDIDNALRLLEQTSYQSHMAPHLRDIRELFDNLEQTLQTLDVRHSQFVDAAIRRVAFHLVESSATGSQLHALLSHMVSQPDQPLEPYQRVVNLYQLALVDEQSPEPPPPAPSPFIPDSTAAPAPAPVELAQARARTQQQLNRATSRDQVRRFVLDLLQDRAEIRGAELPLNGPADLPLLIALRNYGDGALGYTIEPAPAGSSEWVEHEHFSFRDFVLKRTDAPAPEQSG